MLFSNSSFRHLVSLDTHKIVESRTYHESRPTITSNLSFDLEDYKIGMLKIAYEFAVDTLPDYINDEKAILISNILHKQNTNELNRVHFLQDGFSNVLEPIFGKLIDFSNKDRHYLFLLEYNGSLICFVNLFNILSIGVVMSDTQSYLKDDFIIGINDIKNTDFNKYTAVEIFNKTRYSLEYQFQYFFSSNEEAYMFSMLIKNPQFRHFSEKDKTPLFFKNGVVAYNDFSEKLSSIEDVNDYYKDGDFIVEYEFDEDLYVKCLPFNLLVRVIRVKTINHLSLI